MYLVIIRMTSGDSFSLYKDNFKGRARDKFEEHKENLDSSKNESVLYTEILDLEDFGISANGDLYGLKIIDSVNWE